jgi:hypothetical protein
MCVGVRDDHDQMRKRGDFVLLLLLLLRDVRAGCVFARVCATTLGAPLSPLVSKLHRPRII